MAPRSPRTVSPSAARVRLLVRRPQLPLPFRKRIRTTEHSGLPERQNDRQVSSAEVKMDLLMGSGGVGVECSPTDTEVLGSIPSEA